MTPFVPAVVIPVGPGREDNLRKVLEHMTAQTIPPRGVVLVCDGPEADVPACVDAPYIGPHPRKFEVRVVNVPRKHEPGLEQPRNIGVRAVEQAWAECNAVWFLDTDVIVEPTALERLREAWEMDGEERVIMAPYDWLPPGVVEPVPAVRNDPRWAMMEMACWPAATSRGEIHVGLGCFSGNLVWPIREFARVGGFWSDIHHGRCEDGELGLRAVAMDVPITICAAARGYHMAHPVNVQLHMTRNARDVPMLNARHPWVLGQDVFVVERDGRRFEERCQKCAQLVNTGEIWEHLRTCDGSPGGVGTTPSS